MNKPLIYLVLSALVGLCPLYAKPAEVATHVNVSLNHRSISGPQRFTPLRPLFSGLNKKDRVDEIFKEAKVPPLSSLKDYKDNRWFVFSIPVCISASKRESANVTKAATLVPELSFKVYLLYKPKTSKADASEAKGEKSDAAKYRLLEKEITYVDIPLDRGVVKKEGSRDAGYAEMSIGLFIPQTVANVMMGDDDPSKAGSGNDLQVAAFAIEPKFKGSVCKEVGVAGVSYSKGKRPFDYIADKSLERILMPSSSSSKKSNWWDADGKVKGHFPVPTAARLLCISETPYAPFYGEAYPATKPLYGEPESSEPEKQEDADNPSIPRIPNNDN